MKMKTHAQENVSGTIPRDMRIKLWIYSVMIGTMLLNVVLS